MNNEPNTDSNRKSSQQTQPGKQGQQQGKPEEKRHGSQQDKPGQQAQQDKPNKGYDAQSGNKNRD